jgi:hypothetical protein
MTHAPKLTPAAQLASASRRRLPGVSDEYRKARTALLAEEIEFRRHIERVAAQRRDGAVVRHFWADEMGMETADPGWIRVARSMRCRSGISWT